MAKKRGRKLIELDWDQFDKLCYLQCTLAEIASWFECSDDTIERAVKREKGLLFAEYYKKKSAKGKMSLRRHQMRVAENGNVTMLIWLGKQYLGQTEKMTSLVDESGFEFIDDGSSS